MMRFGTGHHLYRLLLSSWLLVFSFTAPAQSSDVEQLDIDWDRDVRFLPFYFEVESKYDNGITQDAVGHGYQVLQPAMNPGDAALVVMGTNPPYNSNEVASFLVKDMTSTVILSQDPIFTTLTDYTISRDQSGASYYLVAGAHRHDTAFVVRNRPGSNHFDQIPLVSGSDHSEDGSWTPGVNIVGQFDYDFDGHEDVFLYVSPGRDIEPRVLACVQTEPFELKWILPVASSMSKTWLYNCGDSSAPALIFSTYGPQNGAKDKNFDDYFGYLTKISGSGEIEFNFRILSDFSSPGLTAIDFDQTRFCLFHTFPLTPEAQQTDLEKSAGRLSVIDRSGSVLFSTEATTKLQSIWNESDPVTKASRIYTLWVGGVIKIYDEQLNLLAESEPTDLRGYRSATYLPTIKEPCRLFNSTRGLAWYSESFELLAMFDLPTSRITPLAYSEEEVTHLLYTGPNTGGVLRVEQRAYWAVIKTLFWEHQDVVLLVLIILTIGLFASNAFRMRAVSKLADREQTLRSLFDNMQDGAYRVDLEGRVVWLSPACMKMLGIAREEDVLGQAVTDYYGRPEKRQELLFILGRDGRVADWEVELIRPGGEPIVVSTNASYFYDRNGEVAGIEGVIRDITDRKESQMALAHSEEKYRLLVENVGATISLIGADGVYHFINEQGAALHGIPPEQIVGKTVWEILPAEIADIHMINVRRVIKKGREFTEETQTCLGGKWYWLQVNVHSYRDSTGEVTAALIIAQDVTEKKKTEERIKLLSSAVEQSSEGLAVVDLDGNILFINEAFALLHGYTPDELFGKHFSIFHTTEQLPAVEAANREIKETGNFAGEIWHVRRDGSIFPALMNNSAIVDENGLSIGIIETMIDITDRKKAEENLRHRVDIEALVASVSSEFISMPPDQIDEGITLALARVGEFIGADRGYLFRTAATGNSMEVTHQWHTEETASMAEMAENIPFSAIPWWHDNLTNQHFVAIEDPALLPTEASVEKSFFKSQGTKSVLAVALESHLQLIGSLHFSCLRRGRHWSEEDIRMMIVIGQIFVNALERKRVAEEIERSSQERLIQERQIAGGFAHEIRNALFPARGLLEKLTQNGNEGVDEQKRTQYSRMVDQSLSRAMSIIRDILDYTRLGSQRKDEEVNLSEIVAEAITANLIMIQTNNVNVTTQGPTDLTILANSNQFYMVINNLLLNALDALADHPSPTIEIVWSLAGEKVLLTITDNGEGIKADSLDRVFDAFYSTKPDRGTGLGLATVRKVVELYQGSVLVENKPKSGAKFKLTLLPFKSK